MKYLHYLKKQLILLFLILVTALIMGIVSAIFLNSLEFVTNLRNDNASFILLLPLVGIITSITYTKYGGNSKGGNNLIIESVHKETKVPLRMALLTFIFTILTHLTGGSAGREGTAVQIGGTLTNKLSDFFKLNNMEKRILIMSGISAAFGSVFGTPLAGTFFGMEMCFVGKLNYEAMLPCFLASYLANFITLSFGITHSSHTISYIPKINIYIFIITIIASCAFGFSGRLFANSIHYLKSLYSKLIKNYVFRTFISSSIVVIIVLLFNLTKYEGLSTWLINSGFRGDVTLFDPVIKLILTVLTLSAGFQGGEVTPLFDIGSSLGGSIANLTNLPPSLFAALGLICVFGSAANTPITTIMLGIDLFGAEAIPYYILSSVISYYVIGHNGIYLSQIIKTPKSKILEKDCGYTLKETKRK